MTRVVMVTGSSHGIGRQIALTLAEQGDNLVLCGRDTDALATVQDQVTALERRAIAVAGDISDPQFVHQLVCAATMAFGHIDGLVNNAGVMRRTATLQTSLAQWEQVLRVNLTSAFMLSQAVLPIMVQKVVGRS
nr:SDR family oxidoreductase [Lacticaseibacillus manihotivorans]